MPKGLTVRCEYINDDRLDVRAHTAGLLGSPKRVVRVETRRDHVPDSIKVLFLTAAEVERLHHWLGDWIAENNTR